MTGGFVLGANKASWQPAALGRAGSRRILGSLLHDPCTTTPIGVTFNRPSRPWVRASTSEISVLKVSVAQVRPAQIRPAQVGTLQMGVAEAGTGQLYALQVGLTQVGVFQIGTIQPNVGHVGTGEVGGSSRGEWCSSSGGWM